jgi:hypothetical protein
MVVLLPHITTERGDRGKGNVKEKFRAKVAAHSPSGLPLLTLSHGAELVTREPAALGFSAHCV